MQIFMHKAAVAAEKLADLCLLPPLQQKLSTPPPPLDAFAVLLADRSCEKTYGLTTSISSVRRAPEASVSGRRTSVARSYMPMAIVLPRPAKVTQ
jgi:hypothetical protein